MSFQKKIAAKEFAVLAEMHTPKGINISRLINDARRLKGRVDAVVVPDMDNGIMRMSALAGGALLQQQGIETIMHTYCRDRNRMALQGDTLAAYVLGIQNLVVAHSEDMSESDHSDAKTVNDLNEMQLIETLVGLQRGKDMSGFDLDGAPAFTIGCTMAACADDKACEAALTAAKKKIAAGASYIIAPPVFDPAANAEFLGKVKALGVPVISSVFLIKSLAIAQYIANSDPSARITEEIIRRIRKSADRELEGIKIAGETILALKDIADGVLIQTLGWEHRVPEILDAAKI